MTERAVPENYGCETCSHHPDPDGTGHCYMFKNRPEGFCMQHTAVRQMKFTPRALQAIALAVIPHQGPMQ